MRSPAQHPFDSGGILRGHGPWLDYEQPDEGVGKGLLVEGNCPGSDHKPALAAIVIMDICKCTCITSISARRPIRRRTRGEFAVMHRTPALHWLLYKKASAPRRNDNKPLPSHSGFNDKIRSRYITRIMSQRRCGEYM